ncbi:hypothetical protein FACS1894102_4150 [Spirochaetia bacterium]|nr:hypothetical protein FACS1894102_4150 [Spirochaetia bacterium]
MFKFIAIMKAIMIYVFLAGHIAVDAFAEENARVSTMLNIENVIVDTGKIYVCLYASEKSWKSGKPDIEFNVEPKAGTVTYALQTAPGDYIVAMYQDTNNNDKCDLGAFKIPKEPIGMSNYSGKGIPSTTFNKLKVPLDGTLKSVTVGLFKLTKGNIPTQE